MRDLKPACAYRRTKVGSIKHEIDRIIFCRNYRLHEIIMSRILWN